jgi:predicted ester cyclase
VAELIARGTHRGDFFGVAATGRSIALPVAIVVTFADGRMSGERLYYDMLTLLRQLGVTAIPPTLLASRRPEP